MHGMRQFLALLIDFLLPPHPLELLTTEDAEQIAKEAPAERPPNANHWACLRFRDERVREMVHLLKYRCSRKIATDFAYIAAPRLQEHLESCHCGTEPALLVPIPASKKRLRERGCNQAALLASAIADHAPTRFEYAEVLARTRNTVSQTKMRNKKERRMNVRGSFEVVNVEKLTDRIVIVIDDVITTGATMEEARRTLLEASAALIVLGAAIAH